MDHKATLFSTFVALTFLSSFNSAVIANISEEVNDVLKAYIKASSNSLDIKMSDLVATIKEEFGAKLDKISESVGYLERREKMVELCPRGQCVASRKCVLSEDLKRSECPCVDGFGGKNCELIGDCFIERYRYSQNPSGPVFPYNCSDDGFYSALQFNETGGYCVTDFNEVIMGYRRDNAEGIFSGTCACARFKYLYKWHGETDDKSRCKSNGDFSETACDEDICWCQNESGWKSHSFRINQMDEFRPICESLYYLN